MYVPTPTKLLTVLEALLYLLALAGRGGTLSLASSFVNLTVCLHQRLETEACASDRWTYVEDDSRDRYCNRSGVGFWSALRELVAACD